MPASHPLDMFPLWLLFIATTGLIVLAEEIGFRFGRARSRRAERESEFPVGGIVTTQLGLLAFLLAFTFAMASSRFDDRRGAMLNEVNAIGTVYLRTAMLAEPQRTEARRLLREYVDQRLVGMRGDSLAQAIKRSEELHGLLWTQAVAASGIDPRSIPVGLFIQALNEMIDLHTTRVTAGLRSRIPTPVWIVLFSVAFLSFSAMGYHSGLSTTSRSPAGLVVALTFAAVIWLVADIDRPGQGALRVSQQPMIELRNSMEEPGR